MAVPLALVGEAVPSNGHCRGDAGSAEHRYNSLPVAEEGVQHLTAKHPNTGRRPWGSGANRRVSHASQAQGMHECGTQLHTWMLSYLQIYVPSFSITEDELPAKRSECSEWLTPAKHPYWDKWRLYLAEMREHCCLSYRYTHFLEP